MEKKWIMILLILCSCSNWEVKNENETVPLGIDQKDSCLHYKKCLKDCLSKPPGGYGFFTYDRRDVRYGTPVLSDIRNGKLHYLINCENDCKESSYCQ